MVGKLVYILDLVSNSILVIFRLDLNFDIFWFELVKLRLLKFKSILLEIIVLGCFLSFHVFFDVFVE